MRCGGLQYSLPCGKQGPPGLQGRPADTQAGDIAGAAVARHCGMRVQRETQDLAQAYNTLRSGTLAQYQRMLTSQDAREGPLAFSEKRPPRWTGS